MPGSSGARRRASRTRDNRTHDTHHIRPTLEIDTFRVRYDNPCADIEGPDRGAERSKQDLYPSEFLRFYTCELVPVAWRRAVAQAIYLFPRDGEHRALAAPGRG